MRELEVHNITKWQPEAVADLIRSRGFKEEVITADHPGFKESQEHFEQLKASMSKEEYEKVLKEMEDLMGKNKDESEKKEEGFGSNSEEVFFDPEEEKKFKNYHKDKKLAEEEREKQIQKNREEGERITNGEPTEQPKGSGEAKADL